jgi:Fur family ferric uptake transcriptional regulator
MANDVFRLAGKRSTAPRRLILEVLKSESGHLDAEAVHDRVKARSPRVSLATVYRSLAVLKDMGLVARHSLGEDHGHFEAVGDDPHFHLTCAGCGAVVEFRAPEAVGTARKVCAANGFALADIHLSVSGYCRQCRIRRRRKSGTAASKTGAGR